MHNQTLWAAYAVSAYGSGFGFGALPLIGGGLRVGGVRCGGGALIAVPLHRRVQPADSHLSTRPHPERPCRPHAVGAIDHHDSHHRCPYRAGGLLAAVTSPRAAIAVSAVLLLATPPLLPRHDHPASSEPELVTDPA